MKLNSIKNSNQDNNQVEVTEESTPTLSTQKVEPVKEDLSGLTLNEKIEYWKNKYKKIYRTIIDDTTFIWRRLNRNEYASVAFETFSDNKKLDMFEKQFRFCQFCVLYPDNAIEMMNESAGIAPVLADEIVFKSGFSSMFPKTEEVTSADDLSDEDSDKE